MTETSCSLSDDDDEPPSRARRATGRRAGLAPGRRIDGSLGPARIDGKARRGGDSGTQRVASGDSGITPRSIAFQSCGRFCALRRLLPPKPAARRFWVQSDSTALVGGVLWRPSQPAPSNRATYV